MAGNSCKSHSTNNTRSNYHLKGSRDDAEEQKQQIRKHSSQQETGGESESVGAGPQGNGFVGGKKFYKKF